MVEYKVNYVSSIYEFALMVDSSSAVGVNKSQLVGTHDGRVIVPVYYWVTFLSQYLPILKSIITSDFLWMSQGKFILKSTSVPPNTLLCC